MTTAAELCGAGHGGSDPCRDEPIALISERMGDLGERLGDAQYAHKLAMHAPQSIEFDVQTEITVPPHASLQICYWQGFGCASPRTWV